MIVDIRNEVFTKIKTDITSATVLSEYQSTTPKFPCITFEEVDNTTVQSTVDTSGEKHNQLSFEINIYSNAKDKITQVRKLRNSIDAIMSDYYGMNRDESSPIPNIGDLNIYRYLLRYSCIIDKNKQTHRR